MDEKTDERREVERETVERETSEWLMKRFAAEFKLAVGFMADGFAEKTERLTFPQFQVAGFQPQEA